MANGYCSACRAGLWPCGVGVVRRPPAGRAGTHGRIADGRRARPGGPPCRRAGRVALDMYYLETGRYSGDECMRAAEAAFAADSVVAIA
ncbi:MAG: lantibiotic dehydratase C-terminal domain-containing protein, partial [Trebonia sp.]